MAAIRAFEEESCAGGAMRPLRIISFENDLDSLRLAIINRGAFPHLRHRAPNPFIEQGQWRSAEHDLHWTLVEGDFFDTLIGAELPEIIFFDPFSYKTDSKLWSLETFRRISARVTDFHVALYTYSGSTGVRAGLLGAGFFVARGIGTGPKAETTIAVTKHEAASRHYSLLDSTWLNRWERSQNRYPVGLSDEERDGFEALIRRHPQF